MSYTFNPFSGGLDYYRYTEPGAPVAQDLIENVGLKAEWDGVDNWTITVCSADLTDLSALNKARIAFRTESNSSPTTECSSTVIELESNLTYQFNVFNLSSVDYSDNFGLSTTRTDQLHVYICKDTTNTDPYIAISASNYFNEDDSHQTNRTSSPYSIASNRLGLWQPVGVSAVSGASIRHVGYIDVRMSATAPYWYRDPIRVYLMRQGVSSNSNLIYGFSYKTSALAIPTGTPTFINYNARSNVFGVTLIGGVGRVLKGGPILICASMMFRGVADGDTAWTAGTTIELWLYKNGSKYWLLDHHVVGVDNLSTATFGGRIYLNGVCQTEVAIPDDQYQIYVEHDDGITHNMRNISGTTAQINQFFLFKLNSVSA